MARDEQVGQGAGHEQTVRGEALVAFFGACRMKLKRVGLEACSLSAWLHAGLTEAELPAICIEARQAIAS